ncbi:MAG: YitT family protein [Bacteroidetes bacterium]|nr:MAG: YitT family protein [Bacteroidota bacterium]
MKLKKFQYPIWSSIKSYSIITLGLFINALAWTAFILPSEIVGGGVTGLSALVYYATGFPVGVTFFLINIVLIIIGIKSLGLPFGIRTIYGTIVISIFLSVLQQYISEPFVSDRFMATIIGGMMGGASVGLVFSQGGSTGGTDIIAMIINKYRNISPGKLILYMDVLIISSSYLLFQSVEILVYGFVFMAVASYSIDMVLMGHRQSVQMFIFSKEHELIAEQIANEIGRGVTLINGKGWYSKSESCILMVVVRRHESNLIFRTIKRIDPEAFISISNVMGVYGKGFDPIRY